MGVGAAAVPTFRRRRHAARYQEGSMTHVITRRHIIGFLEHTLAIFVGFILMVVGLGLSVTMVMLPIGLVVGLAGLAMFIAGFCVRFDWI
jgi:hypothetical protein